MLFQFFQHILASWDKAISDLFHLQSWRTGNTNSDHQWTYFVDFGPTICIVGTDGKIHTMMSYWSVHHYYDRNRLLKRISVRKDLKDGERLATPDEIAQYREESRKRFAEDGGLHGMINW